MAGRDRLVSDNGEKPFMVEGLDKSIVLRLFVINKVLSYPGPDL